MSFFKYLLADMMYRKAGYAAILTVVAIAVAATVFLRQTSEASIRSIQLITKNMGQNIIVIHENTTLEGYYSGSDEASLIPQRYVDTLAGIKELQTTYHVAILQKKWRFHGADAILTGALPVKGAKESDSRKNPFIAIKNGTVRLGSEAARESGLKAGDKALILGEAYKIERVEAELGTMDDYRVYMDLSELQDGLDRRGEITAILSLECLCAGVPLSLVEKEIRNVIRRVLPDVRVLTLRNIALARYEARLVTEKYNRILLILILAATVLFIGIQSYSEAEKREKEMALLSAVGFPFSITIMTYVAKAFAIALPAAVIGFFLGQYMAVELGPLFAKARVTYDFGWFHYFLSGSCLVVLVGFIPAMFRSLRVDPFEILREE